MCGRYSLSDVQHAKLAERFLLTLENLSTVDLHPRYNVAPGQPILAVMASLEHTARGRRAVWLRWGLVPSWSRDGRPGPINARAETAGNKPMFAAGLRRARCLIPADGFYEWRRDPGGGKTPIRFVRRDGALFALAGVAERWVGPSGAPVLSCAVLTTKPNPLVQTIHDRMPVILRPEREALWLDPHITDPAALVADWQPYPSDLMRCYPVSTRVNSPSYDGPECITPAG